MAWGERDHHADEVRTWRRHAVELAHYVEELTAEIGDWGHEDKSAYAAQVLRNAGEPAR